MRAKPRVGCASGEFTEFAVFAIKGRFYTQTFRSPDTPDGSCSLSYSHRDGSRHLANASWLPVFDRIRAGGRGKIDRRDCAGDLNRVAVKFVEVIHGDDGQVVVYIARNNNEKALVAARVPEDAMAVCIADVPSESI